MATVYATCPPKKQRFWRLALGFEGDEVDYSDIDLFAPAENKTSAMYTRKDGAPYTDLKRRAKKVE